MINYILEIRVTYFWKVQILAFKGIDDLIVSR